MENIDINGNFSPFFMVGEMIDLDNLSKLSESELEKAYLQIGKLMLGETDPEVLTYYKLKRIKIVNLLENRNRTIKK